MVALPPVISACLWTVLDQVITGWILSLSDLIMPCVTITLPQKYNRSPCYAAFILRKTRSGWLQSSLGYPCLKKKTYIYIYISSLFHMPLFTDLIFLNSKESDSPISKKQQFQNLWKPMVKIMNGVKDQGHIVEARTWCTKSWRKNNRQKF